MHIIHVILMNYISYKYNVHYKALAKQTVYTTEYEDRYRSPTVKTPIGQFRNTVKPKRNLMKYPENKSIAKYLPLISCKQYAIESRQTNIQVVTPSSPTYPTLYDLQHSKKVFHMWPAPFKEQPDFQKPCSVRSVVIYRAKF